MATARNKPDKGNSDGDSGKPIDISGKAEQDGTTAGTTAGSDGSDSSGTIDPGAIPGDGYGDEYERDANGNVVFGKSGQPRKKRGRKTGSSNGGNRSANKQSGSRNPQTLNDSIKALSDTLLIVHLGIASYTGYDGFALEEKESETLSRSIVNVMDQFSITVDPKLSAIAGLVTVSAQIYGPRAYNYFNDDKRKKEKPVNPPKAVAQKAPVTNNDPTNYNLHG